MGELAAGKLRAAGDKPDPGAAAKAICDQALVAGSDDNLSCMIVLLGGGCEKEVREELAFVPGPFLLPCVGSFRKAYAAMAEHAGLTLADAVEMRYEEVQRLKKGGAAGAEFQAELTVF